MSIMRRVRDMTVATLNDRLDQCEDPVRMIDQYLLAQRDQIIQSERLYQQCLAHAHGMRQQYLTAEQTKEKREQQALTAMKAGEEMVARMALQEKMLYEEKSEQYKKLYEQSKTSVVELEEQLQQLRADYQEVLDKRQYYVARMETVRLQQQMNQRMANSYGVNPGWFNRLESRVSDMELETRALRDVRKMGQEALYQAGTALHGALDRELESLKKKLEQEGWQKP